MIYIMQFQTPEEIQTELGERLRKLRLDRNLTQQELADRAQVATRVVHALEAGAGVKLVSYIRVLKALGQLSTLDALAPAPTVDPLAMLRQRKEPRRASKARRK